MRKLLLSLLAGVLLPGAWAALGLAEESAAGRLVGGAAPEAAFLTEGDRHDADAGLWRESAFGDPAGPEERRSLFAGLGAGPEDLSAPGHPWLSGGGGDGLATRLNLGVARYDNRHLREAANYEYQLYGRLVGTWGLGLLVGGGWGTNSATGSIARGDLETGLVMATTSVDIPLGRGNWPILSLGIGFGGFYADPNAASDVKEDLDAQGLELEQGHHWYADYRARADLLFPLDRQHHGFVAIGAARDWAGGALETRTRDLVTGLTTATDRAHMSFDRTTFQLSLVVIF